jgi:hypothetical protein
MMLRNLKARLRGAATAAVPDTDASSAAGTLPDASVLRLENHKPGGIMSPHITDQLPLFDAKQLRPVLRTRADVEAATVTREEY